MASLGSAPSTDSLADLLAEFEVVSRDDLSESLGYGRPPAVSQWRPQGRPPRPMRQPIPQEYEVQLLRAVPSVQDFEVSSSTSQASTQTQAEARHLGHQPGKAQHQMAPAKVSQAAPMHPGPMGLLPKLRPSSRNTFESELLARLLNPSSASTAYAHPAAKYAVSMASTHESFEVQYNFSLPYERAIQPGGLTYPVHVWRDAVSGHNRIDTYGSTNSLITTKERELEIMPRMTTQVCTAYEADADEPSNLQAPILPDVSGWVYNGREEIRGQEAESWTFQQQHGKKVTIYTFHATLDGAPLRLHMHGNDLFSGSHFDEWVADYTSFRPGRPDPVVFDPPKICENVERASPGRALAFRMRMGALLPHVRFGGDEQYDEFVWQHSRRHGSQADYDRRAAVFRSNVAYIDAWNANRTDHVLGINHLTDWTQEEFEAALLPRHGEERPPRPPLSALLPHDSRPAGVAGRALNRNLRPAAPVPTSVDWRGTAAGLVKDQAACGSCWAFGASGAMEAAFFMATGVGISLSEQQLMDCSWDTPSGNNMACDGGDPDVAIQYVVDTGGIALNRKYEYLGQDGYCQNLTRVGGRRIVFKGFVAVPAGDDAALKEAVYTKGPVAVSLDASQPSFRFYAGGVYDDPSCMWKPRDLDHSVMVDGYGTTENGKDYWLVRNSWSRHWGDEGYIKIARGHHACGITSDALYAVIDESLLEGVQPAAQVVLAEGTAALSVS
ncbi:hypothetical protein WJX72_003933 [[Myrmecia] bisecta]|uniref:Uncharacterized protein n=1 Tax=[Myrmecia] bisecta TaxID=41462 RepID=A0AAW1Q1Y0_9CHLO